MAQNTADPFVSAKRRLARANEHIADIKSRIGSFLATEPYARTIEENSRGLDEHKIKLTKDIPPVITDIVYGAVEALRSSCDHATYAIAIAAKSKRPNLIHFPVADNRADFENILNGRLKDFPPNILALFRSFEPYESGNILIWALNRIRRQGTHRLIIPVGTAVGGVQIENIEISSPHPCEVRRPEWDSEKNEMVLVIVGRGSNLQYNINLAFFVAFGPVEGLAGEPVAETLESIAGEVERIVLAMEAEARRIGLL